MSGMPNQGSDPKGNAPYESVVAATVARIREDSLLFVIGIAALLVGLAVLAAGIGTSTVQFIAVIIGVLAFVAILGYYIVQARRTRPARPSRLRGNVKVDVVSGAKVAGIDHASSAPPNATVDGDVQAGRVTGGANVAGVDFGEAPANQDPDKPK